MKAIGWIVIVLSAVSARTGRADDKALAEATFEQGRKLLADGKLGQACAKFEASYRADPALGTLLNLGECHAKLGRTATAWAELREAEEMAHLRGDARENAARTRADALEPKLDRLRIVPPQTDIPGLIVARDGADATGAIGADVPVDPGEHTVEVSAVGYAPWRETLIVRGEGTTTPVEVPSLAKLGAPEALPAPAPTAATPAPKADEAAAAKAIVQARDDWKKADAAAEDAATAARAAADTAAGKARALRVLLFRSWTPPKRTSAIAGVMRNAVDARVAALYGRCADMERLAAEVREGDEDFFDAVLAPDPLIAWCGDR